MALILGLGRSGGATRGPLLVVDVLILAAEEKARAVKAAGRYRAGNCKIPDTNSVNVLNQANFANSY